MELLQAVCTYCDFPNNRNKTESAKVICEGLDLECDNIDFNDDDDTISAGFIEKIINKIK